MGSRMNSQFLRMSIAAGVIAVAMAGCASHYSGDNYSPGAPMVRGNFPPPGAAMVNGQPTGPPPKVEDCAVISVGSPMKYECNGKQYTSFELNRMRTNYKNTGGGPSETVLPPKQ
jgi:hypothetical protein